MRMYKKYLLLLWLLAMVYLLFYPITLDPIARKTPPYPGLTGDFKPNSALASVQLIDVPSPGPESIVQDASGYFFTGLANGDIYRFDAFGNEQTFIVNTGGRPLGMKITPNGELIIADQKKGLLALDSLDQLRVLVDEFEGEKLRFVDDLTISKEGVIYFSNATQRNPIIVENEAWEQRASGALFAYYPESNKTLLLKDDLFFPNGMALNRTEDYFVFSETFGLSLYKYWLKGEKANTIELFNNSLPGYPDNVTFNDGIFWVAIPSQRVVELEPIFEYPFLRSIILRLPEGVRNSVYPPRYAMLIGLDEDGNIRYNLQDPEGKYDYITSVLHVENKLYLGSLKEPHFAIYNLE